MGLSFSTGNRDYWCVIAKGNAEHIPKAYSVTGPTQTVARIRILESPSKGGHGGHSEVVASPISPSAAQGRLPRGQALPRAAHT